MAKSNEPELREAAIKLLRKARPGARIIHELNVAGISSNRADLACISEAEIILVELKSNTDNLSRLDAQLKAFSACSHICLVMADDKFFNGMIDPSMDKICMKYLTTPHCYHDGKLDMATIGGNIAGGRFEPRASAMLEMLWADELRWIGKEYGVVTGKQASRAVMIAAMTWYLSGREVCEGVCKMLRSRSMTEGDDPIPVRFEPEEELKDDWF